jgi:centromeric protein E
LCCFSSTVFLTASQVLQDLLNPQGKVGLKITEDKAKGVCIQGANEVVVRSAEAVLELLAQGEHHRHFAETAMNSNSSRSHTLFKTIIESRPVTPDQPKDNLRADWGASTVDAGVTYSMLNLVDLAGSERQSKTGASGQRLKEGNAINKVSRASGRLAVV